MTFDLLSKYSFPYFVHFSKWKIYFRQTCKIKVPLPIFFVLSNCYDQTLIRLSFFDIKFLQIKTIIKQTFHNHFRKIKCLKTKILMMLQLNKIVNQWCQIIYGSTERDVEALKIICKWRFLKILLENNITGNETQILLLLFDIFFPLNKSKHFYNTQRHKISCK